MLRNFWEKLQKIDLPKYEKIKLWGHACGKAWATRQAGYDKFELSDDGEGSCRFIEVPEFENLMPLDGIGAQTAMWLLSDAVFDETDFSFWEKEFAISNNGPNSCYRLMAFYRGFCAGVSEVFNVAMHAQYQD